jgi:hypothetical protein
LARTEDAEEPTDGLLNESGGMAFMPAGDVRDTYRKMVSDVDLGLLLAAWKANEDLYRWADALCDAVEQEVRDRRVGPASEEWVRAEALLIPRVLLMNALRGSRRPADRAFDTLSIMWVREMILAMKAIMPNAQWSLLSDNPFLPACLYELFEIS